MTAHNVAINSDETAKTGIPQAVVKDFTTSGLGKLHDFVDSMVDIEESLEDIKIFGGPEVCKKADKLIKSVRDFKPSVTMIGQIKSGKTSLVNAMAGMPDLLPADVNPWTSVVTSLHLNAPMSDKIPTASFRLFDRHEWDHLVEKGGRLGELSKRAGADDEVEKVRDQVSIMREKTKARLGRKFELLLGQTHNYKYLDDTLMQRYVCMGDDFGDPNMQDPQGQFADITKSADLYLESPAIGMPLCIRDTPGVNDTFMMREQITISALRTSRTCVVVLSAAQALNSIDMGLIRLISNVKSRDIVIFVNRIDELANPVTEIKEIKESILKTLADNNGPSGLPVIFGSAYWANMALLDQAEDMMPQSAASLAQYCDHLNLPDGIHDPASVWQASGVPALFDAISERIVEGEGEDMIQGVRRSALNHLHGLKASSLIVSLRLNGGELDMMSTPDLISALTKDEVRLGNDLNTQLNLIIGSYQDRIDETHKRFLDRAVDSLLQHLETNGEDAVWQYSPEGLRVLLRSSYQMMQKKTKKACDKTFDSTALSLTETYLRLMSVDVEGFRIAPPVAPTFPSPVTLGQTIALDLQSSWWGGWWKRRRGYRSYSDEFYKLIEAETASMIQDMKVAQAEDVRTIAVNALNGFLSEQRGILMDVSEKSEISLDELNGLFGITEQEKREEIFAMLLHEFATTAAPQTETTSQPEQATRPVRPMQTKMTTDTVGDM